MVKDYVESQIAERREKLLDMERQKVVLNAEIAAFEDVLAHLADQSATTGSVNVKEGADSGTEDYTVRVAAISPTWKAILLRLAKKPSITFGVVDMMKAAEQSNFVTTDVNVRSQLSIYTSKGLVKRIGAGQYIFPEAVKTELRKWEPSPPRPTGSSAEEMKQHGIVPDHARVVGIEKE